jgi:hypothetical protein
MRFSGHSEVAAFFMRTARRRNADGAKNGNITKKLRRGLGAEKTTRDEKSAWVPDKGYL